MPRACGLDVQLALLCTLRCFSVMSTMASHHSNTNEDTQTHAGSTASSHRCRTIHSRCFIVLLLFLPPSTQVPFFSLSLSLSPLLLLVVVVDDAFQFTSFVSTAVVTFHTTPLLPPPLLSFSLCFFLFSRVFFFFPRQQTVNTYLQPNGTAAVAVCLPASRATGDSDNLVPLNANDCSAAVPPFYERERKKSSQLNRRR